MFKDKYDIKVKYFKNEHAIIYIIDKLFTSKSLSAYII